MTDEEWIKAVDWFMGFAIAVMAGIGVFAGAGIWLDGGYPVLGAVVALLVLAVCFGLARHIWRGHAS